MKPCGFVYFDLDGTLIDHFKAICRCYNTILREFGHEEIPFVDLKKRIGPPLPVTISEIFHTHDKGLIAEVMHRYQHLMSETFLDGLEVLPGALWILQELKKNAYKIAVFTNKRQKVTHSICNFSGFTPYLDAIIGTEESVDCPKKPEMRYIQTALNALGAQASDSVMIGDSEIDLLTAKVGHFSAAYAVATGTHSAEKLAGPELGATKVFSNLYELGKEIFHLPVPKNPILQNTIPQQN